MINYIGNIIKNKSRKKINHVSQDSLLASNNNLNSSPSKNLVNQFKSSSIHNTKRKHPSSLLWVLKVNFNQRTESENERTNSGKHSRNSFEMQGNEEICNPVLPKMKNYKINKNNYNNCRIPQIKNKIQAEFETPNTNKRKHNLGSAKSPPTHNRISDGLKTSQETHRNRVIKNELSNEKKTIFIKELIDPIEKEQTDGKKNPLKLSEASIKKNKFKLLKEKLPNFNSKSSNVNSNDNQIKNSNYLDNKIVNSNDNQIKNANFLDNKIVNSNNEDKQLDKISKPLLVDKNEKRKKRKKEKRKKRKQKKIIEKIHSDNDLLDRIKQNLLNLFEKQRINRLDVKKSYDLPKIENRLPEQKTDKSLGSPINIRKSSNPNLNINININFNNPVVPFTLKPVMSDIRVEISQSFFKKPFEYIAPYDIQGEANLLNYNSFTYNKDYLNSIERITKIFRKNFQILPQTQPIQLNSYTYVNFVRSDGHILSKVMKHRVNWHYTISNKFYNFRWNYSTKGLEYSKLVNSTEVIDKQKVVNHFEYHTEITDKKRLFINLLKFCDLVDFDLFKIVPFTVIISYRKDVFDLNMKSFSDLFNVMNDIKRKKNDYLNNPKALNGISTNLETIFNKNYTDLFDISERERYFSNKVTMSIPHSYFSESNLWIIKPSDLCQGNCMKISNDLAKIIKKVRKYFSGIDQTYKDSDDEEFKKRIELHSANPNQKANDDNHNPKEKCNRYYSSTVILQKYLEKPLLYMNRKFDIRVWVLIDHDLNVYFFKEGHLKCSSEIYDVNNKNQFIHITNYSVQKYSNNFEKYEFGNEVSFSDFQQFLNSCDINVNIQKDIMHKLKRIIEITAFSANKKLNKKNAKYCFEILGYDFIIDCNFDVWLLEVNDNPGLCESSPLIKVLVPRMMDDAFRLTIDKIFQTKYSDNILQNGVYKSPFPVTNYSDEENMFEFICNVNIDEEEYIRNIKSSNSIYL